MGVEKSLLYALFSFLGTLSVYNAQRLFKIRGNRKLTPWLQWVKDHFRLVIVIAILSGLGAATCLLFLWPLTAFSLGILLSVFFMGFFYVVRLGEKNLRSVPFLKIHVISFSWALLLIIFPLINQEVPFSIMAVLGAHYLYVLAVTVPFDIRDLQYDKPHYKTIPQMMGVRGAKWIALAALLGFVFLTRQYFPELWFSIWFWGVIAITASLILGTKETTSDWYCAGMIDGSISLLGLVYLLA